MAELPDYVTTEELVARIKDLEERLEQARVLYAEQQAEIERLTTTKPQTRRK